MTKRDPERQALVPEPKNDRERLTIVLAEANGFATPLRVFQKMATEQIYVREINAILKAGWSPSMLRADYEASQEALSGLMTENRLLHERLNALAAEWETHGFAQHNGAYYADALRDAQDPPQ